MNLVLLQPSLRVYDNKHNLDAIKSLVAKVAGKLSPDDIVLLPEHFAFGGDTESYLEFIRKLAQVAGCTIVGGSHHRKIEGKRFNVGTVVDAKGKELGTYSKLRPYFNEQNHIAPGTQLGEFTINGRNILVLICADFWYSDILLKATKLPDVVLVPSLSVSRKPNADY